MACIQKFLLGKSIPPALLCSIIDKQSTLFYTICPLTQIYKYCLMQLYFKSDWRVSNKSYIYILYLYFIFIYVVTFASALYFFMQREGDMNRVNETDIKLKVLIMIQPLFLNKCFLDYCKPLIYIQHSEKDFDNFCLCSHYFY